MAGKRRGFSRLLSARAAGAAGIVLLFPAVAAAMIAPEPHATGHAAAHSVRWGCLIGLVVVLTILLLGWFSGAHISKVFVGQDGRISTSKTIAAVWTIVVTAMLFGLVWANLFNHPQALNATGASGVIGQYAVLFGGPLGAAILAKQIVTNQVNADPNLKPAGSPSPKDLIANDVGNTDLGDLQYVLFNAVALFFVVSTLLHDPLRGLPHIPDVLLGLTSVSAVGYVGKKALTPSETVIATFDSTTVTGSAGSAARIVLTGLASATQQISAWVRFGESHAGQFVVESSVALGEATLEFNAPPVDVSESKAVDVSVVTEDGAVLSAGKYTYT